MKVGDFIKVLQGLNPESSISFSLGRDDEYRAKCAKAELIRGECLGFLSIDRIEIYPNDDDFGIWADIILEQTNFSNLEEMADEFDEQNP